MIELFESRLRNELNVCRDKKLYRETCVFDAKLLKSLQLYRKGFDLDFEIFVKLYRKKCFFLEVPVHFKPRTPKQGKKITALDGLKCLFYLIFSKIF